MKTPLRTSTLPRSLPLLLTLALLPGAAQGQVVPDPTLWSPPGLTNPSGARPVPIVQYDPGTGILSVDTLGLNRGLDTGNPTSIGGDDVGLISLLVTSPPATAALLDGFIGGVTWSGQHFDGRQQLYGVTTAPQFLPPGVTDVFRYPAGLGAGDFGPVEMGINFDPGAGAILHGAVQISDPTEACCFPDGSCLDLTVADCAMQGATAQGEGTRCPVTGGADPDGLAKGTILDTLFPGVTLSTDDGGVPRAVVATVESPTTGDRAMAPPAALSGREFYLGDTRFVATFDAPVDRVELDARNTNFNTTDSCRLVALDATGTVIDQANATVGPGSFARLVVTSASPAIASVVFEADAFPAGAEAGTFGFVVDHLVFSATGTTCTEACCLPDGDCMDLLAADCMGQGGTPQGPGTNCVEQGAADPDGVPIGQHVNTLFPGVELRSMRGGRFEDVAASAVGPPTTGDRTFIGDSSGDGLTFQFINDMSFHAFFDDPVDDVAIDARNPGGSSTLVARLEAQDAGGSVVAQTVVFVEPGLFERLSVSSPGVISSVVFTAAEPPPGSPAGRVGFVLDNMTFERAALMCPQPEACCLPDGTCADLVVIDCEMQNGVAQGPGSLCAIAGAADPDGLPAGQIVTNQFAGVTLTSLISGSPEFITTTAVGPPTTGDRAFQGQEDDDDGSSYFFSVSARFVATFDTGVDTVGIDVRNRDFQSPSAGARLEALDASGMVVAVADQSIDQGDFARLTVSMPMPRIASVMVYRGDGIDRQTFVTDNLTFARAGVTCDVACCFPDGSCLDLTPDDCTVQRGTPQGTGTTCATARCEGACCLLADGMCVDDQTAAECTAMNGEYAGLATVCANISCTGACCLLDGSCLDDLLAPACTAMGGRFEGRGTLCATVRCAGACCLEDGVCLDDQTFHECSALQGDYRGLESTCAVVRCEGACCLPDGDCADGRTLVECTTAGGAYRGLGSMCVDVRCEGACCLQDGTCLDMRTFGECKAVRGSYQGLSTTCMSLQCPGTTVVGTALFADLDGGPQDDDGMADGTFTVNGNLTVTGAISCNDDAPLPSGAPACPVRIVVGGNLVMDPGAAILAENGRGGGDGGAVTLEIGGSLFVGDAAPGQAGVMISGAKTTLSSAGTGGDVTITTGGQVHLGVGSVVTSGNPGGLAGAIAITAGTKVVLRGLVAAGPSADLDPTPQVGAVLRLGNLRQAGGPIAVVAGTSIEVGPTSIVVSQGDDPGAGVVLLEGCPIDIRGQVASVSEQGGPSRVRARSGTTLTVDGRDVGANFDGDPAMARWGQVRAGHTLEGAAGQRVNLLSIEDVIVMGPDPTASSLFAVSSMTGSRPDQPAEGTVHVMSESGMVTASGNALCAGNAASNAGTVSSNRSAGGTIVVHAALDVLLVDAVLEAAGDHNVSGGWGVGGTIDVRSFQGAVMWVMGRGDVRPVGTGAPGASQGTITITACGVVTTMGESFPVVGGPIPPFPLVPAPDCSAPRPSLPPGEPLLPCD